MNESRLKILVAALVVVVVALLLERFGFYTVFPTQEPTPLCVEEPAAPRPTSLPYVAVGNSGIAIASSTLPDTLVGRGARWGLDAINLQRRELSVDEVRNTFAPSTLERATAETIHASLQDLAVHGPYVLAGLKDTTTETRLEGVVLGPENRVYDLVVAVEEAEPHRLTGFLLTGRVPQ